MLTVSEVREMYKVASLEEKVMMKIWLLGLRIGDACRLEKELFVSLPSEELVEILVYTKKEQVVAHCFIDKEFKELLVKHLPNLDKKVLLTLRHAHKRVNHRHMTYRKVIAKIFLILFHGIEMTVNHREINEFAVLYLFRTIMHK